MTGEFDLIARYFAPLASTAPGAFDLTDDAALVGGMVVTKDVLVEGVHFRSADDRERVAKKSLRVNLSDLAAMGAKPVGYFLGVVWRAETTESEVAAFAKGLAEDQELWRIALFGGDSTRHMRKSAPLTISVTMIGQPAAGGVIRRNGAKAGDDIYVSGAIGDAALGLKAPKTSNGPIARHCAALNERYMTPTPRVALGGALAGVASAAIDISDGLIADARHIARQSSVQLRIALSDLPLSEAVRDWLQSEKQTDDALCALASGGDDYELLFTAPPSRRRSVELASQLTKTPVARIGSVARGGGVQLAGVKGTIIEPREGGWDHFAK
jgi:thiamine-monophosphate kinase